MRMAPAMMTAHVRPMTSGAGVVVRLEDELVALFEQQPERRGAHELEEREAATPEREPRGEQEEGGRAKLEREIEGVHAPRW
jgi:hypothetical protein